MFTTMPTTPLVIVYTEITTSEANENLGSVLGQTWKCGGIRSCL